MNILFLVLNIVGNGTYLRAYHLARELVERGHAVTLVATSRQRRFRLTVHQDAGVTQVETPDLFSASLRSGWDPWNAIRRIVWLQQRPFDVIHSFETRPTVLLPMLYEKHLQHRPVVLDWADWFGRGGSVEERPNRLIRGILRPVETYFEEHFRDQADRTTVISSTLSEKAQALGVDARTIMHLPNGCDTERLFPIEHDLARQRTGLDRFGPIIGYCGAIFARDAHLMAAAFDHLQVARPDSVLLVVGHSRIDMRRLVARPDAVVQTGYVAEHQINDYLNACDICWLPLCDTNANRGRWPMKLNDYMAVGRPTVATAVGDVADLLRQEAIGLLSPADPVSFAQQTVRLIDDPSLRRTQGRRARELALTRFSWVALAIRLEALYAEIA